MRSYIFRYQLGYPFCIREILVESSRSVLRRVPFEKKSWLYAVAKLIKVECKCSSTQECPRNMTGIKGTGVIPQEEGCDLFIG
jgi:hypothetical protein